MTTRFKVTRRSFGKLALSGTALAALGAPAIVRAQTAITFAVPNPSALTWLPYWVAVGEGYFADEGITPTLEAVDGSSAVPSEPHAARTNAHPRTTADLPITPSVAELSSAANPRPRRS